MKRGINVFISPSYERLGYRVHFTKYLDNKIYRIDTDSIKWIETSECSVVDPIFVDTCHNYDSIDKQHALYGENQALKDEIKFLREQINKLMDRV